MSDYARLVHEGWSMIDGGALPKLDRRFWWQPIDDADRTEKMLADLPASAYGLLEPEGLPDERWHWLLVVDGATSSGGYAGTASAAAECCMAALPEHLRPNRKRE